MTSFMAQCSEVGKWLPMNLKYVDIKNFCKMLEVPEVIRVEIELCKMCINHCTNKYNFFV